MRFMQKKYLRKCLKYFLVSGKVLMFAMSKANTDMEEDLKKLQSDLFSFVRRNSVYKPGECKFNGYSTLEDIIEVVKDEFFRYGRYKDFAGVIITHRELFEEYQIFANQNIRVHEGQAYLCVSEGEFSANVRGTSTANVVSCDTSIVKATGCHNSIIKAESYGISTIEVTSYNASTVNANSDGISTIKVHSYDASTINAKSKGDSEIFISCRNASKIDATGLFGSTIRIDCYDALKIKATGCNASTIIIYGATKTDVVSHHCSTIIVRGRFGSNTKAQSWDNSTIIIRYSTPECEAYGSSIIRCVSEIITPNGSIEIGKDKE